MPVTISTKRPYSRGNARLYTYIAGTYLKFKTLGKCLPAPLVLQIQTQSFCNGRCLMCPYPAVSKNHEQGRMKEELFEKITRELNSLPYAFTVLFELHNEPLMDERIFEWIRYFKSINPDKYSIIVTNGHLLERHTTERILGSRIDSITVSLNASSKETYSRINRGLDFDRVIKNISRLLENPSMKQKTTLGFVLMEKNKEEVLKALIYWKSHGVETRVLNISNRAGTLDCYEDIRIRDDVKDTNPLREMWGSFTNRMTGCRLPFLVMNILFNGDVILCCHDWNRKTVLGNVSTQSIREVWNSDKTNEVRGLILAKKYGHVASCKGCSLAV